MLTYPFPKEQIKRLQKNSAVEHEFSVVWVPRRTLVANKILEEEGVLGDVSVEEFPLYFVPLEHDVLSLALEDSFSDLYLVNFFLSSCFPLDVKLIPSSKKTRRAYFSLRRHSCQYSKSMDYFHASSERETMLGD